MNRELTLLAGGIGLGAAVIYMLDPDRGRRRRARSRQAAALRKQGPARIVVAVPVSSPETCDEFRAEVDDIVCAVTPRPCHGVGMWYEDFSQTDRQRKRSMSFTAGPTRESQ